MAQPVVHFEVVGKDPARLRAYFSQLFGRSFAVPSPVAQEVSAPDDYGFLDLIATDDGTGIRGGVGGGPGYESHALFYVGVPDVGAALWASTGLTDIHHQGQGPRKDVQNGDHGEEEAAVRVGSFTPEFKAEIVELCQRGDRSIGQVARDFDLTETNVRTWVKQDEIDQGERPGLTTEEKEELTRLRRENRSLKEDVEILKRATVFFAKETR